MVRPKWFLPVWLFLGLMCGLGSATAQTNVTGDWDVTVNLPQGPRTAAVSLKQDGDKVTGLVKSRGGELAVEGTIDGSNLRLAFTLNYQGQPLPITITGTVDGPSIAGKADFAGMTEGDFSARRADVTTATEPAAASTSAPASASLTDTTSSATPAAGAMAGKWDVTFKTQGGEFPVTATLTDEAGKILGTMATQLGELTLEGTIEGKVLKLSTVARTPQGDIPVALTGDVDGDSIINGKADFGGMGQGEWTAKRSRQ
jgi:hypothetical protein